MPKYKASHLAGKPSFHIAKKEPSEELEFANTAPEYAQAAPVGVTSSAEVLHKIGNTVSRQGKFQALQRAYGNSYAARVAASFKGSSLAGTISRQTNEEDLAQSQTANAPYTGQAQQSQTLDTSASPAQRSVEFGSQSGAEIARTRKKKGRGKGKGRGKKNHNPENASPLVVAVEQEEEEKEVYENAEWEQESDISLWGKETGEDDLEHGEKIEEEEQAKFLDLASYFDLNKIVIDLGETSGKTNIGGGELSGSAKGKSNKEGMEGEGQVDLVFGKSHASEKGMNWDVQGNKLDATGKVEAFLGAKAKAKGKGNINWGTKEFALKGKTSAFIGGSVEVELKTGVKEFGNVQGNLGLTLGIGGEYEGQISWTGGTFKFGGKAKLAAGVGLGMSYKVEIETANIMKRLYSVLGWVSGWFGF